nr:hypothetical protein [uncultured bacterium]
MEFAAFKVVDSEIGSPVFCHPIFPSFPSSLHLFSGHFSRKLESM